MTQSMAGRVVTRFGSQVLVEDDQGAVHRCTTRRRLEHGVCNDRVQWHRDAQGHGVVTDILPRTNLLERVDPRGNHKSVAANLSQVVVVIAPAPEPNWSLVDRYLAAIERMPARGVILFNKVDLLPMGSPLPSPLNEYRDLGYDVIHASVPHDRGMDTLRAALSSGVSVLVGQSGVGKSSLVKALLPDLEIRIGALSEMGGEGGRHTTTNATLYPLECGGALIDSPGVRDFTPGPASREALVQGFVELRERAGECRFQDCSHTVEPGCAVIEAVKAGHISPRRYESYRNLLPG